jgi:hypothetical protein
MTNVVITNNNVYLDMYYVILPGFPAAVARAKEVLHAFGDGSKCSSPNCPGAGSAPVLPLTQYLRINVMTTNNNTDAYTTVVLKKMQF